MWWIYPSQRRYQGPGTLHQLGQSDLTGLRNFQAGCWAQCRPGRAERG